MNDKKEKGAKWWVRYVIVPIVVACISGGGIYTLINLPTQNGEPPIVITTPIATPTEEPVQLNDVRHYAFIEDDVYYYDKGDIRLKLDCERIDVSTGQVRFLIHYGQTTERITFYSLGDIYSFRYKNKEYQIRYQEIQEEESLVTFFVGWKS